MTNPSYSYTVVVYFPGRVSPLKFNDKKKAKDYYTDMLLKYPNYNVEFLESEI